MKARTSAPDVPDKRLEMTYLAQGIFSAPVHLLVGINRAELGYRVVEPVSRYWPDG